MYPVQKGLRLLMGALLCAALPVKAAQVVPAVGVPINTGETRRVSINGVELHPLIETKRLPSGREGLPVWFLPRLGVQTYNEDGEVRLSYAGRTLRFAWAGPPPAHWTGLEIAPRLSAPERYGAGASVHVGLDVLRALGVPLNTAGDPHRLDVVVGQQSVNQVAVRQIAVSQVAVSQVAARPPKPAPVTPPRVTPLNSASPKPAAFGVLAFAAPLPASSERPATGLTTGVVISSPVTASPVINKPIINKPANGTPVTAVAAAPAGTLPPAVSPPAPSSVSPDVPLIGPRVLGIRSSSDVQRSVQLQRVVIDLTGPVTYSATGPLSFFLLGASAQAGTQTLDSGDSITLSPGRNAAGRPGTVLRLQTRGAVVHTQTLSNPERLVIDTAALVGDAPPPINPDALPAGINMRQLGALTLLSFDPQRYRPRVVAAPTGSALSVAELVRRVGGVAGVNGGYFDPPSSLSVDFVGVRGQMLSGSLEKRAAVGFDAQGKVQFGYPRPRYFVSLPGSLQTLMVNAVTARPAAGQLSAFVGNGRTLAGGAGLSTLLLTPLDGGAGRYQVQRAVQGGVVVPAGTLSLSFDPQRFALLPTAAGATLNVTLDYQLQSWSGVQEGLAAGPLLVAGGRVVIDPVRESFNIYTGIWRPTRQVAFALYQGQPTIAFMDFGTPDSLAAALQKAGVSDAMRLDSGSSATVYVTGGYLGTGGYLNTVWSRPVPNALVLVPR